MTTAAAPERDRSSVADRYKWNLTDLYPNDEAWRTEKARLAAELPALRAWRGQLAQSASLLADALEKRSELRRDVIKLYVYAELLSDQDTRDSAHQGMTQEMTQLYSALNAEASYIEPEILRADRPAIESFVANEPRLAVYRHELHDMLRRAAHTLSDGEEKLLADAGPLAGAPASIFNILSNADFPYPVVTLSDGRSAKINHSRYTELRAVPNRADRQAVQAAYFTALGDYRRTFGTMMDGQVQKVQFYSKARKYGSALEYALDTHNVPTTVYTRLIEGVNRHLASFHRFLSLRKRMLGVDQLHYYDLYAPLVASVDADYTPEEGEQLIVAALAPLGPGYQTVVSQAFNERWIDMYPNEGKRSGAYSQGAAYDVHPYILMNYNGKFDDVSTLAHELGHTMQSYLSNRHQPFPTADYPIFTAEVASTFNEALLLDYMLRTLTDDDAKLSLLGQYLEGIQFTVFRQTQFAEFELRMHEMAARGEPVTGDALAELYYGITRRYYGHDAGICVVDDYIRHEWSFISHFYAEFYVYQYATAFTASEALASRVKAGDTDAAQRYLAFLSAGGSKYPIELLKDAGVDMTTDEPLDLTMRQMTRVMDEMEGILDSRKS
ncbi:MAG TPA: oligoendopeptidase F [Vicinamibacterales bacterium]|nr:oligoendopeptidase F [Vicinamibacterales bacterium]